MAAEAGPRGFVNKLRPFRFEPGQVLLYPGSGEGQVVEAGAPFGQEPPHRGLGAKGGEELEEGLPFPPKQGHPHPLVGHLPFRHHPAAQALAAGLALLHDPHGDAHLGAAHGVARARRAPPCPQGAR